MRTKAIWAAVALVVSGAAAWALLQWSPTRSSPRFAPFASSPSTDSLIGHSPVPATTAWPTAELLDPKHSNGLTSMPWRLASIDSTRRTLHVYYVSGDGDCITGVGFRVIESPREVVIDALSQTDRSQGNCADRLVFDYRTVTLTRPLGIRRLVHAPVAVPWNAPNYFPG